MEEKITNYIKHGGNFGIFCNSPDIEGDSIEVDDGTAQQNITCLCCGATWTDNYKLRSISNVKEGK